MTDVLKPGPISSAMLENNARLATAFELMDERSEFSSEIPSPVDDALAAEAVGAGASGSVGDVR